MILLTGISGFIGKHLLKALIADHGADHILALTSQPVSDCSFLLHNDYNFTPEFFEQAGYSISKVIHAGAYTPKNGKEANRWTDCTKNITNTYNLLKSLPDSVNQFIFLSTLDVYGIVNEKITEKTVIKPASLYGSSKWYGEQLVEKWALDSDKKYQILRIGHVYGPGEEAYQKIIPITIRKLLNNQAPQIWGNGYELRSFIYIMDVVNAIIRSLSPEKSEGPINIVSEDAVSIQQIIKLLIEISGLQIEPQYNNTSQPGRNLVFDNSKMKNMLYTPQVILRDGLQKEWDYMHSIY